MEMMGRLASLLSQTSPDHSTGLEVHALPGGAPTTPHVSPGAALWWRRAAMLPLLLAFCAAAGCSTTPRATSSAARTQLTGPLGHLLASQEQTVQEIVPSGDIARVMAMRDSILGSSPVPGSDHAFTVAGSPMVGAGDTSRTTVVPGQALSTARTVYSACVFYAGTGLPNGTGIDSDCEPVSDGSARTGSPVLLIPGWPTPGVDVYVWTHLPQTVQTVTYSYQGRDRTWVTPVDHTALVSVPRPPAFDGSYEQWHSAPFPLLQSYDAHHHLVAGQYAPRVGGDTVPKVH